MCGEGWCNAILLIKRLVAHTQKNNSFNERNESGNKSPTKQQVRDAPADAA